VSNSSIDNKIQPENGAVEETAPPVEWDNVAIAVPHDMKTDIIVAARNARVTVSEWGRRALEAALDRAKTATG
jgi:hypothetical protein